VRRRRGAAVTTDAPAGMVPVVDAAINRTLAVPAVVFVPLCAAVRAVTDAGF